MARSPTSVALIVALSACGASQKQAPAQTDDAGSPQVDDAGAANRDASTPAIDANVRFTQLVDAYDTLDACQRATSGSGFNCNHSLTLCKNGGYLLILTDIENEGAYRVEGSGLHARAGAPGDGPDDFTVVVQGETLTSSALAGRHAWQKSTLTDAEASETETACSSLEGRAWWQSRFK